jgi:hypothetical protein
MMRQFPQEKKIDKIKKWVNNFLVFVFQRIIEKKKKRKKHSCRPSDRVIIYKRRSQKIVK